MTWNIRVTPDARSCVEGRSYIEQKALRKSCLKVMHILYLDILKIRSKALSDTDSNLSYGTSHAFSLMVSRKIPGKAATCSRRASWMVYQIAKCASAVNGVREVEMVSLNNMRNRHIVFTCRPRRLLVVCGSCFLKVHGCSAFPMRLSAYHHVYPCGARAEGTGNEGIDPIHDGRCAAVGLGIRRYFYRITHARSAILRDHEERVRGGPVRLGFVILSS